MLATFRQELHVDPAIGVDLEEQCIVCLFHGTTTAAASADAQ
jgi:hypothetical protein